MHRARGALTRPPRPRRAETIIHQTFNQQKVPLALRLSGQLLLGVVRIYSRKLDLLHRDSDDALLKIRQARGSRRRARRRAAGSRRRAAGPAGV